MEEEILMQRREEEGRGKERRKALLEKEERKWKEIEASLISSIPNAGSREAAAVAAAVRAVGGDSVLDDSFARERVSSIARRIRTTQLARRALQVVLFIYFYFFDVLNLVIFLKGRMIVSMIYACTLRFISSEMINNVKNMLLLNLICVNCINIDLLEVLNRLPKLLI